MNLQEKIIGASSVHAKTRAGWRLRSIAHCGPESKEIMKKGLFELITRQGDMHKTDIRI